MRIEIARLKKERITKEIKKIHKESYEIYGSPKITELLNKNSEKVSQKYVYSIMKENNIKAKYIKPYIQTTVSHDFSDKLKNLLNRHYNPTKPNVTWWKISKNKQAMIQDIHANWDVTIKARPSICFLMSQNCLET